jgi:hypothetical protein
LLVRPNQAHDALPEIVFPAFFVFVIHGPSKKQNTENGTDKTFRPADNQRLSPVTPYKTRCQLVKNPPYTNNSQLVKSLFSPTVKDCTLVLLSRWNDIEAP